MSGRRMANYGGLRAAVWRSAVTATRAWRRPTSPLRAMPDFLLIGAQRSGTTSLYEFLRGHPDVRWPAMVKSPHWFDTNYTRPRSWYRAHFPIALGDRSWVTGEASPYYLHHPHVPERIAAHLPESRLIAILRDPVARAFSAYQHEVDRGNETLEFRAALQAEAGRVSPELPRLADPGYVGHHHRYHAYVGRGLYADQLARYQPHVPRERLLVLILDELKAQPQATYDRVCDFLDISRVEVPRVTQHNARDYDPMQPEDRAWLEARFDAPNQRLAEMLGRELPW